MSNQPPPVQPQIALPPIRFIADGPSEEIKAANLEAVLPSPGYPTMAIILADAIVKRTDVVVFDFTAQNVEVRFQIDGYWHSMPTLDRTNGDYMLASLKRLANLDIQERRLRQQGFFVAEFTRNKFKSRIVSQGTKTGERVVIYIERRKPPTETLEECGMRAAIAEQVRLLLGRPSGLFLVSCLPGDGLTTAWRATLQACDRFVRDFFVVEEATKAEPEVINVNRVTYDRNAGEDPTTVLPRLLLRQPDVIAVPEIVNGPVLDAFSDLATRDRKYVLTRTHARSAVDAVLKMTALKGNIDKFATALLGVICHRTMRKLCSACKRGFPPSPALLEQLGLPQGRVATMYQRYEPRPEDFVDAHGRPIPYQPCTTCGGTGFMERTAAFEFLQMNDPLRAAIRERASSQQLAGIARQHGHVTMRDEAILLIARGVTAFEEVQRVFKQ
jgi:type II secretory ATPase GspE/PulE/Tfp pilus assembly ATPase PilB-like protein